MEYSLGDWTVITLYDILPIKWKKFMKVCKECKIEKELDKFKPLEGGKYRSNQCKECRNKGLRTGKPNTGRYKKGHKATHSPFVKGMIPWNKGKYHSIYRYSKRNIAFTKKMRERDGNKCTECGAKEKLAIHHIKPWKDYPDLRFDESNVITLCVFCHGSIEGPLNANNGIKTRFQKGHKLSQESIEKMKKTKRERKK